jgi:hypothetical protein
LTMSLCSANGTSAICSIRIKNITTRLAPTYHCKRMRRSPALSRPSVVRWPWADCTTNISEREFSTGTGTWRYRSSRSGKFIDLLAASQVGLVVDVRTIPRSRTNPQFNREALPESLAGSQIAYEHVVELGGRPPRARDIPPNVNGFWENQSFHNLRRLCDR